MGADRKSRFDKSDKIVAVIIGVILVIGIIFTRISAEKEKKNDELAEVYRQELIESSPLNNSGVSNDFLVDSSSGKWNISVLIDSDDIMLPQFEYYCKQYVKDVLILQAKEGIPVASLSITINRTDSTFLSWDSFDLQTGYIYDSRNSGGNLELYDVLS